MSRASFVIVAAEFNRALIDAMVAAAEDELSRLRDAGALVVRVPGCYEVPLIVDRVLARRGVEAAIVLGYIERGETQHGEVMGNVVHKALMDLSLIYSKPIGLGIIGPGATEEQAETRKEAYARAAVRAALASLDSIAALDHKASKRKAKRG